jgi:hypothetical protein
MTKETQLINLYTIIIIGNNIDEIVTQVLSSFDHAQHWDNKIDTNIEGHYTHQDMLEVVSSGVSSLAHHKTGGESQGTKIPIHPSPLHP